MANYRIVVEGSNKGDIFIYHSHEDNGLTLTDFENLQSRTYDWTSVFTGEVLPRVAQDKTATLASREYAWIMAGMDVDSEEIDRRIDLVVMKKVAQAWLV